MLRTEQIPLLPLRDIVVFPHMVVPLFVGREKSIQALSEAMKKDKKIVLVTQKNSEVDDPGNDDIFNYGCECRILQLLKLPDGTVKVLTEGINRVKIFDFYSADNYIELADLSSREDLLSRLVGGLNQPMSKMVGTLNGAMSKFVGVLNGLKEEKD